jgi:peptidoglycan/LPS O-acetylase OafA/YrhL
VAEAGPPRKRKRRGAGGGEAEAGATDRNGSAASRPKTPRERMEAGYAKAEVRNQAVRESLVPLEEGERPPVVTFAAILAALVALSIVITFAAGVKVNGSTPKVSTVAAPALIMGVLAWGMWRARYWAVVAFQVVLVFLIFCAVYGLMVIATSLGEFAVTLGLLVVSSVLFWLMVKAMARIQMPERMPPQ